MCWWNKRLCDTLNPSHIQGLGRILLRFELLTPHQLERLSPYIDTVFCTTVSPLPHDVALPYQTSQLISDVLLDLVVKRYGGRGMKLTLGAMFAYTGIDEEILHAAGTFCPEHTRFGVLLVDRLLTKDAYSFYANGIYWTVFDWWQWIRNHLPPQRQADALMYLVHTNSTYFESHERAKLGIDEVQARAMVSEGQRLLAAIFEAISLKIETAWQNDRMSPNSVD